MQFLNDVTVELLDHMGSDAAICQAARVSLSGMNAELDDALKAKDAGLINYLAEHRHGSPFEATALKFYVKAPIFVFREFHRHRIGWSYNEMSGRYTELPSEFYVPAPDRKLVNVGSSARPVYEPGTPDQVQDVQEYLEQTYQVCWDNYQGLLSKGIAKEVARLVLPVGIMSQMITTCNARSMMAFLSLRTDRADAKFPSHPQREIEMVADKLEAHFRNLFPVTHAAFEKNGRVSP